MKLSVSERLLLLALHPNKNRFLFSSQVLITGVVGSVLIELSALGFIEIDNNEIKFKHQKQKLEDYQLIVSEKIKNSLKGKKVRRWISKIAMNGGKLRWMVIEGLEKKKMVRIIKKKFLFIPYREVLLLNGSFRNKEISHLRGIVFKKMDAETDDISLLALMHACKMHRVISKDRQELKLLKKKMKSIIEKHQIAKGVDTVIKEMQAAVMVAITSSAATTAATAGAH